MVPLLALMVVLSACLKVVGTESTTLLLPRAVVAEDADNTTSVWSAGINSTVEPVPTSHPPLQPFPERVYKYWHFVAICLPILSFIGIIGNILSIIVLYSREMWSSTGVFLIALASFDSILLLTNILNNIDVYLENIRYRLLYTLYFAQPMFPVLYSLTNVVHMGTVYTVVSVTVERYIAICHPLKAASYCTISKAKKVILVVAVMCVLYNIPRYMEMSWVWKWEPELNRTMLNTKYSDMAHSKVYLSVYLVYVHAVFKLVIPSVALLTLNIVMVRKLYHTKPSLHKQERKGTEKERFTAMVLAVCVVFMISLSVAFLELLMFEINSAVTMAECSELCGLIAVTSQLVIVIHSSINFILFCFFGQKFRKVFATKFMSCCRR